MIRKRTRFFASGNMVLLTICIATGIACAFLWPDAPFAVTDTGDYVEAASDLRDGSLDQLHYGTPGLPLILAFAGTGRLFLYCSLIFHFLAAWLLILPARAFGLPFWIQVLLLMVMISPPYMQIVPWLATETLAELCLVAGVVSLYFCVKTRNYLLAVLSGCACGYASLTRPTFGLAGVLFAILTAVFYGRAMMRPTGLLLASFVVFPLGFSLYNYTNVGYFGPSYSVGYHLATRVTPLLRDVPDVRVREALLSVRNRYLMQTGFITGQCTRLSRSS